MKIGSGRALEDMQAEFRYHGYQVVKDFADGSEQKPVVPGFPAAKCFTPNDPGVLGARVQCVATADRYVITVFSKQSADAIQQISAQYLMLVAK